MTSLRRRLCKSKEEGKKSNGASIKNGYFFLKNFPPSSNFSSSASFHRGEAAFNGQRAKPRLAYRLNLNYARNCYARSQFFINFVLRRRRPFLLPLLETNFSGSILKIRLWSLLSTVKQMV